MTTAYAKIRQFWCILAGVVLSLLVAASMLPVAAFAAPGDTTYTVRLYGGNRGTVNGQEMVQWDNVAYGSAIDLGSASVAVTDGKYYAKGVRPAGQDNVKDVTYVALASNDGKLYGSVPVTEDADYVVAYGVLADRVEYTVRYVDTAGNELAPAQTLMGDVGDMPAVAARYIENYVPNAYEATRALEADPAQNVITFTYARLAAGYTTVQNPNGTVDVVTPGGDTVNLPAAPAATVASGNDTVEDTTPVVTPDGTEIITDDGTPLTAPIETLTIEDDEVPLASMGNQGEEPSSGSVFGDWASVVLIAGGIALLIVAIVLWARSRSRAKHDM